MRYSVVGLGAVGSIIGGLLTRSGENIILVGKKNQVDVIKNKGVKIVGINGTVIVENIQASATLSSLADADIIFICVKSQDTKELANNLKRHLKKSAVIVSLQNGIRNAQVLEDITGNKALTGIVLFNALYSQPGEVVLSLKGSIILEYDKNNRVVIDSLLKSFKNAGLKVKPVENIEGLLWSKLILNLQNAITALTGQTIKNSIKDRDTRKIIIATMKEGVEVVEKSGIRLETLPEIDPKRMIKTLSTCGSLILGIGSRIMGLKENARNSMWQSLSRGKPTEIDYINGEIVKLAEKNNLEAPINTKLVELIKNAEKKHLTKSLEPSELKELT